MDNSDNIDLTPEDSEAMRLLVERIDRLVEIMDPNAPLDALPEGQFAELQAIHEEMARISHHYDNSADSGDGA